MASAAARERSQRNGALRSLPRPIWCGACPIPASSGKTQRHRLNRGGNRQANSALHMIVICRTRAEAKLAVFSFIEGWYNPHRRHSSIDYLSPVNYEQKLKSAA